MLKAQIFFGAAAKGVGGYVKSVGRSGDSIKIVASDDRIPVTISQNRRQSKGSTLLSSELGDRPGWYGSCEVLWDQATKTVTINR